LLLEDGTDKYVDDQFERYEGTLTGVLEASEAKLGLIFYFFSDNVTSADVDVLKVGDDFVTLGSFTGTWST
jgi:hypothetical protein